MQERNNTNYRPIMVAIDDDPVSLEFIRATLEDIEVDLHTFDDPEEGLAFILENRPPVVLLDFMMPKMNGMQVMEKIVEVDPGIEIIFQTAQYSTGSAVE